MSKIKITSDNVDEYYEKVFELVSRGYAITNALDYYNINRASWYNTLPTEKQLEIKQEQLDVEHDRQIDNLL